MTNKHKIVLQVPTNVSPDEIEGYVALLKKFVDDEFHSLILPSTFKLDILEEKQAVELQETVDEIWIYKVKEDE
jgi:hypothetical protein